VNVAEAPSTKKNYLNLRAELWFAIKDWLVQRDFDDLPEDAQITIVSLAFQLGLNRYQKFVKHHAAIQDRDWKEAAAQLRDSKLYKQTTNRTERHAARLEALA